MNYLFSLVSIARHRLVVCKPQLNCLKYSPAVVVVDVVVVVVTVKNNEVLYVLQTKPLIEIGHIIRTCINDKYFCFTDGEVGLIIG